MSSPAISEGDRPLLSAGSFEDIYEPSGLVYVGDKGFILIEDEADHPFHLVRLDEQGRLQSQGEIQQRAPGLYLNDLEGIAFDGEFVYVITSHSLTKKGKPGKGRSILARYRYVNGELQLSGVVKDLKPALINLLRARYPLLSEQELEMQLNIEALSWSPVSQALYIGLRAPVVETTSLVIRIDTAGEMFEGGSIANVDLKLIALDLAGLGIRAMSWDQQMQRTVIVAGDKKKREGRFTAWSWDEQAKQVLENGWQPEKATEGLAKYSECGLAGWVYVQDDGKRKKGRSAHYQTRLQ